MSKKISWRLRYISGALAAAFFVFLAFHFFIEPEEISYVVPEANNSDIWHIQLSDAGGTIDIPQDSIVSYQRHGHLTFRFGLAEPELAIISACSQDAVCNFQSKILSDWLVNQTIAEPDASGYAKVEMDNGGFAYRDHIQLPHYYEFDIPLNFDTAFVKAASDHSPQVLLLCGAGRHGQHCMTLTVELGYVWMIVFDKQDIGVVKAWQPTPAQVVLGAIAAEEPSGQRVCVEGRPILLEEVGVEFRIPCEYLAGYRNFPQQTYKPRFSVSGNVDLESLQISEGRQITKSDESETSVEAMFSTTYFPSQQEVGKSYTSDNGAEYENNLQENFDIILAALEENPVNCLDQEMDEKGGAPREEFSCYIKQEPGKGLDGITLVYPVTGDNKDEVIQKVLEFHDSLVVTEH